MATAIFPGSFNPFTTGHEAILRRILPLFDRVVVAVGVNSDKQLNPDCHFLSPDQRVALIRQALADCPKVDVLAYSGMTIDLCHQVGASAIIRGIRTKEDFDYEQLVASVNRAQDPSIETLLVMADADHRTISSTLERERLIHLSPQTPTRPDHATL